MTAQKKILIACPEKSFAGGMGRIFWQLAEAGSKYSDWETHLISPKSEIDDIAIEELDVFREILPSRMHIWKDLTELVGLVKEYDKEEDFDLIYMPIEFLSNSRCFDDYYSGLDSIVLAIHNMTNQVIGFNEKESAFEQYKKFKLGRTFPKLLEKLPGYRNVHLVSKMEEKIWKTVLPTNNKYIMYPDMLMNLTDFGLPWEERSNSVLFCGRITSTMKGFNIINELISNCPENDFKIMCPEQNLIYAKMKLAKFKNIDIVSHTVHDKVLEEFGRHKYFCNPGTYGSFDLTTIEASSQGCCIIADKCIGSAWHFENLYFPKEHTTKGFKEAIEEARKSNKLPESKLPNLKNTIQQFFDDLYGKY